VIGSDSQEVKLSHIVTDLGNRGLLPGLRVFPKLFESNFLITIRIKKPEQLKPCRIFRNPVRSLLMHVHVELSELEETE